MNPRERKYITDIRKTVGRAINRYRLISAGDRVLIALSGGKDSLVLLDTLAERRRYIPIHYDLIAAHIIVPGITPAVDVDYLAEFCARRDVPFHHRETAIDRTVDPRKSVCFLCAWNRRKTLFSLCGELGCGRIAFGHHRDDVVETLMMNMILHARISSLPAALSLFRGALTLIRPLIFLNGARIKRYADIRGFKTGGPPCRHAAGGKRDEVRRIIGEMSRLSRRARENLFHSTSNIEREYLP